MNTPGVSSAIKIGGFDLHVQRFSKRCSWSIKISWKFGGNLKKWSVIILDAIQVCNVPDPSKFSHHISISHKHAGKNHSDLLVLGKIWKDRQKCAVCNWWSAGCYLLRRCCHSIELSTNRSRFIVRLTSICEKWICLLKLWQKTKDNFWNIWESCINLYNQKESVLCIEVTKIGEKWLVLLILQG